MEDYFGNPIKIGDDITYITVYSHKPVFNEGKVLDIDDSRRYRDTIKVLGNSNNRPGWTYADRIIVRKFVNNDTNI